MNNNPCTQIKHSQIVECLAKSGATIADELSPQDAHLLHMGIGVCGEAGELIDAIKKGAIYRKEYDVENIIEEIGDIEFYLEGIRNQLNITRDQTLKANIKKLTKRYESLSYKDSSAQNRADKNI